MSDKSAWKRAITGASERLSGILGREKPKPVTNAGFNDLPNEIVEKVVKDLATSDPDDPRATALNLNNLRQTSPRMRDVVENTPSVGEFLATLNEAGRLAKDLHERAYPKNGLPEVGPDLNRMHEVLGQVSADLHVAAVGPTLKFQPARQTSKVLRDVRAISNPDDKAASIVAVARNIGNLAPQDQSSIIGKAIKYLGAKGPLDTIPRLMAGAAIASARDHLQPKHQSKLTKIVRHRPELNEVINSEINRLENRGASNFTNGNAAGPEGGQTKSVMADLRERFELASTDRTINEHQRVLRMKSIATSTAKEFDNARADLMKSRSRESRGR